MNPTRTGNRRPLALEVLGAAAFLLLMLAPLTAGANQVEPVSVLKDSQGMKLQVDGRDFMVLGMNWGYMPIGENYSYDFWGQSDEFIETVLATEMTMLQNMGVNTIRQYVGIPPRWVEYIWKNYGIYTVINHAVARYGANVDGVWVPNTDYGDPRLREQVKAEVFAMVEEYKDTPGLLMWLLGNENNYSLAWSSFEIEDLPEGQEHVGQARSLYSLMGELIDGIHARDSLRPVSMANGDLGYLDVIVEMCPNLDIFGTNVYRGISVGDMNQRVKDAMGIPLMYTEFGSDAFNARTMQEDQTMQARYLIGQWQEIYERSYGKGQEGNHIGGMIFQWSDGWWKFRQEERLDIHDTNASWATGAYVEDYVDGENNMNEEWWGICAKGPTDNQGYYTLYPRAAYYALTRAFKLAPYGPGTDVTAIRHHFAGITTGGAVLAARGDQAALAASALSKVRVSGLRMELETFSTGATNTMTRETAVAGEYPSFLGFDHQQSYYVDFEAKPANNVTGTLSLNILGNVADNPMDEIYYENRGRGRYYRNDDDEVTAFDDYERLKVYQADLTWDDKWFEMQAFYRTGHYHWGDEGDFFGLYRNAFYGENIDIYNGEAPFGAEVTFKKELTGLKAAFGPQLWWGANPAVFLKYQRRVGIVDLAGLYHEDIAAGGASTITGNSSVHPSEETRKVSLQALATLDDWTFQGGMLWSGSQKVGREFDLYDGRDPDNPQMLADTIRDDDPLDLLFGDDPKLDTWGFKGKISTEQGAFRWYGQMAYMGLVADGGPTEVTTFTGWKLKDSGSGNQKNFISGFTYNTGDWQIGPNFLWQKPIVGPVPAAYADDELAPATQNGRNLLYDATTGMATDPFAVIDNREMTGAEVLLTYDPHPETWFYAWDNDKREGARWAFNLGFVYKDLATTRDAKIFYSEDGTTPYAFAGAAPAHTEWELHSRVAGKLSARTRIIASFYAGEAEPNGWTFTNADVNDATSVTDRIVIERHNRIIHRYGADVRLIHNSMSLQGMVKINDWGVYDYHKDWSYTYPLQLVADVSYSLGRPVFFGLPETKLGVRFLYRTLDENSNRYREPGDPEDYTTWEAWQADIEAQGDGTEWELRTYMHLAI